MANLEMDLLLQLETALEQTTQISELLPSHLSDVLLLLKRLKRDCSWNTYDHAGFNVADCIDSVLLCIEAVISVLENRLKNIEKRDSLDCFCAARKEAIERTIVVSRADIPKVDDLMGLDEAKRALREALIDPFVYPEWFSSSGLKPWRCVLLYGPPGTGKTHLSRSVAREVNSRFYMVSSADLVSSWSGQSEKLIRELFDHALSYNGVSIIFIDEVDSLCRTRFSNEDESSRRIKTELLLQLQRLHSTESSTVLICATNCPWDLDAAFLRRFEKRIYVGLPNFQSRRAMLKKLLGKICMEDNINWDMFAQSTDTYSGDDLKRLSREVAFVQFRKYKEGCGKLERAESISETQVRVSEKELNEVLQNFSPSINKDTLSAFLQYET